MAGKRNKAAEGKFGMECLLETKQRDEEIDFLSCCVRMFDQKLRCGLTREPLPPCRCENHITNPAQQVHGMLVPFAQKLLCTAMQHTNAS